jgi:hypothetical protein
MQNFTQKFIGLLALIFMGLTLNAQSTSCDTPMPFSGNTGQNMTLLLLESFIENLPELTENAYLVAHGSSSAIIVGSTTTSLNDGEVAVLTIWGDDSVTPEIDGAQSGEAYWLQLVNENSVYNINDIVYEMGSNIYQANAIYTITSCSFELFCSTEDFLVNEQIDYNIDDPCTSLNDYNEILLELNPIQFRSFSEGWNMFGFPCKEQRSVSETFEDIVSDVYIIKNNEGQFYWPEYDFDGIGELIPLQGYQTKIYNPIYDFSFCENSILFPVINGCTDCNAFNYNPFANNDDGSCVELIDGCIYELFYNYDSLANVDDGSCIPFIYGCIDETAFTYNSEANTDDGSCVYDLEIGDSYQDGIIFYLNETGSHGLVSAIEDLGYYSWGCHAVNISGLSYSIGAGLQNTLNMVEQCPSSQAATAALAYESENYTDWYLPSRDELVEMYNTIGNGGSLNNIGNFINEFYQTSNELTQWDMWVVDFTAGNMTIGGKGNQHLVRPIRSF